MSNGRELLDASAVTVARPRAAAKGAWRQAEGVQAIFWVGPTFLYLAFFIAYPFLMSIYLSVSSARVGSPDFHFVGFLNYSRLFDDPVFWQTVRNSFVFTFASEAIRLVIGLPLAFALNRTFKGKRLVQDHPHPVRDPHRPVLAGVEVDVRFAVQRHQLDAHDAAHH